MKSPFLEKHQFAVGKADYNTGHVLKNDGTVYQNGQSPTEMYEIFESYPEAEVFALQKIINNPVIECWIVDAKGEYIATFDKEGQRHK